MMLDISHSEYIRQYKGKQFSLIGGGGSAFVLYERRMFGATTKVELSEVYDEFVILNHVNSEYKDVVPINRLVLRLRKEEIG